MATLAQPAGPFALGTFSAEDGQPFPGILARDRVLDLSAALDWAPASVRAVLERWEETLPVLHSLAEDDTLDWRSPDGLRVHAPLEPRQVFQSGANYRQHVIDLEVAHRSPDAPRTVEEARAEIAAVMDRRAAEDLPYVFIGLPNAITGPYDDVVLPSWAEKPDWELELAAVIGKARLPGLRRRGAGVRRRLHHRQRPHRPRHRLPPGHARHRHRLAALQERPRLHPARSLDCPRRVHRRPG